MLAGEGLVEVLGRGGDERLVDPALVGDVGEERIEEREVGAGVDSEVQHVVLAGLDLAGIDRHGAPRIDDDDPGRLDAARGQLAFFLSSEVPRRFGTQWFRK